MTTAKVERSFRALIVREASPGTYERKIEDRQISELPENDILIKVLFSSLNYKDGLSATGSRGVTRRYPHTPGVDAAGIVVESNNTAFAAGDEVIVIDYDLGMNTPGGFGQYIRVPAGWIVHCPAELGLQESMSLGTAGFTAAMSLERLQQAGVTPGDGDLLVTGASGGVGSVAVALANHCGYVVVAATGKLHKTEFLHSIGASKVIPRSEVEDTGGRPLVSGRWQGAIETAGGTMLGAVLAAILPNGVVTCCGNAAGAELVTSVYPFILRGISLLGIDAGNCPIEYRDRLWKKLATDWKLSHLSTLTRTVSLDELDAEIVAILNGEQVGRVVVDLWA